MFLALQQFIVPKVIFSLLGQNLKKGPGLGMCGCFKENTHASADIGKLKIA